MKDLREKEGRKRELDGIISRPDNIKCFDCLQSGISYANMTVGSFVCTKCSGILRGLTPPHRLKSVSICSFSQDEINFLEHRGNNAARLIYGASYSDSANGKQLKKFLVNKYNAEQMGFKASQSSIEAEQPPIKQKAVKTETGYSNRRNLLPISDIVSALMLSSKTESDFDRKYTSSKVNSTSSTNADSRIDGKSKSREILISPNTLAGSSKANDVDDLIAETLNLFKSPEKQAVVNSEASRILEDDFARLFD